MTETSSKMQYYGDYNLLLIDVGNTRTKVRIIKDSFKKDVSFPTSEIKKNIEKFNPNSSVIAVSVVNKATEILKTHFKNIKFITAQTNLPIKINYLTPQTLGTDRIAHACGGLLYGNSFIIVNAGTTTVIDIVKERKFLGGWILPGIKLSSQCLYKFTSKLPLVENFTLNNFYEPGNSTTECIEKGILLFTVSSIQKVKKTFNLPIILTGGNGKLLTNFIKAKYVENLTLNGLEVIANFSSQS
ncbi:type III pantothenate kinase [Desulfurobacterium pacificum]|uniref:Type III pantothenate kinase n=2 Tax=Desulfurobacterium pacificum TaxID=240166 RepID=A0ABY1NWD6_9BACT|nr:type III pantothenate kinase [Desulfurobacterium pacificum]